MASEHLSKQFDNDLETLRSGVLQMGGLVEAQIRGAIEAFSSASRAAMEQVIGIMVVIVVIGLLADKIFFSPIERFLHRRWGLMQ